MTTKSFISLSAIGLFMFYAFEVSAQSKETTHSPAKSDVVAFSKSKALKQWWLGVVAEPAFGDVIQRKWGRNEYPSEAHYAPGGGMAFGFDAIYLAGRTASIETGLQYKLSQVKVTYSGLGTGTFDNIHSLEAPLLVNLHTHGSKLRFYAAMGFATGFDLVTDFKVTVDPMTFAEYRGGCDPGMMSPPRTSLLTPNIYVTFILRTGVEYSINKNTMLKVGAAFNVRHNMYMAGQNTLYQELPYIGEGNQFSFYPYSIGFNVAILFSAKASRVKPEPSSMPATAKKKYQFLVPR